MKLKNIIQEQQQQDSCNPAEGQKQKVEWAKVTLNGKTKRIYNPAQSSLDCFISQIQSHFKELSSKHFVLGGDLALRESVMDGKITQQDLVNKYFQLKWQSQSGIQQSCYDQKNTEINIMTGEQYQEIMAMHAISEKQNIPRFTVSLSSDWVDQEFTNERNLSQQEAQLVDQEFVQPNSQQQLPKQIHQESSSSNDDGSSSDEEKYLTKEMVQKFIKHGVKKELNKLGPTIFQKLLESRDLNNIDSCYSDIKFNAASEDEQLDPLDSEFKDALSINPANFEDRPDYQNQQEVPEAQEQQQVVEEIKQSSQSPVDSNDDEETEVIRISQSQSSKSLSASINVEPDSTKSKHNSEQVPEPIIQDAEIQDAINLDQIVLAEYQAQVIMSKSEEREKEFFESQEDQNQQSVEQVNQEEELKQPQGEVEVEQELTNFALTIKSSMNVITIDNKNAIAKFFQKIADKISDDLLPQVEFINDQNHLFYEQAYNPSDETTDVNCSWTIRNCGGVAWPEDVQLVPCFTVPRVRSYFSSNLQPLAKEATAELMTRISIPAGYTKKDMTLMFRFRDKKMQFFGPSLVVFIKLVVPSADKMDKSINEKSSFAKEESSLITNDPQDLSGTEISEVQLFSMSSDLMDEGYGSFDRCLSALRVARGDLTEAKVILSSLMMAENQFLN